MAKDKDPSSAPKKVFDVVIGWSQIISTVIGLISLIISFLALIWMIKNPNSLPPIINIILGEPTPTPVILPSSTPLPTYTALPTYTPFPTNTLLPENTALPTNTPYPTNTPKPSISLPFKDNFSNGINPPWYAYSGKWLTTSSGATITITDSDLPSGALILDDPTLTNYRLRVNIHSPYVLSASQGNLGVVVRYQSERDQNLIFFMNSASRFYWGYTSSLNPDFGSVLPITDVMKANIISDFTLELDVSGNTFTAKVNGEKYDSFSLTGYETGGVVLIPVCGNVGACPSFSNFLLEPLP